MHHHYIDKYAYQSSPIHQLHPTAKILATITYTLALLLTPKYQPTPLLPLALFPILLLHLAKIPWKFVLKHILAISPFILTLALLNPIYDNQPTYLHHLPLTTGWLATITLLTKFTLSMMALIALVSTTPFYQLLTALSQLGAPRILTLQLHFLYRYLFLLIEETQRMLRARKARNGGKSTPLLTTFTSSSGIVASLFLKTLHHAQRIQLAMRARGFQHKFPTQSLPPLQTTDALFLLASLLYTSTFCYLAQTT